MALLIPAAEFKRKFSEFIGRVIHGKERLVITRHGKPVAEISPVSDSPKHPGQVKGWLDDSDPFFQTMDSIVADRLKHTPRAWSEPEK